MKKLNAFSALLLACLLAGCTTSGRDPMQFKEQAYGKTSNQVRNSIINAALANDWSVCDAGDNRLRADTIYKNAKVYADIAYSKDGFLIEPIAKYSTNAYKDGTVHRTVNNLIKRLYVASNNRLDRPIGEEPIKIPSCVNYDSVAYEKSFKAEKYVTIGFAWVNKPKRLADDPNYTFKIIGEADSNSRLTQSLEKRMKEFMRDAGIFSEGNATYKIEIHPQKTFGRISGTALDYAAAADFNEDFQIQAVVFNRSGEKVCVADVSTKLSASRVSGESSRVTNKEVEAVAEGLVSILEEKLED